MAIKKIDIYPQIYAYTKDYVLALIGSPTTEPDFTGEQGAWFGLDVQNKIYQYSMNPCVVDENVKPLTIFDNLNSATHDIESVMKYQNIIDYFRPAILLGSELTGSNTYVTIEFTNNVDFVFPKDSVSQVLLPMRVRFFYRVTYGDDNLVAMFPTKANVCYETVLNATRNFQFTPATADARWGSEPEWKLFDKTGLQIDVGTGINPAITSEYEEFYISVNVPVLGGSDKTSVNHYDIDNFSLHNGHSFETITTNNYPPALDLGMLMEEEGSSWIWKQSDSDRKSIYDNSKYYLASARFSRTILFKIHPDECMELIAHGTLNLTYFDPIAARECETGYKANLTITLANLTLSADSGISLDDELSGMLRSSVSVTNPSNQSVEDITYSLKIKRYAIRTKTTSTDAIDLWGALVDIAGDGIDVSGDWSTDLPGSIASGYSASGELYFGYYEMLEIANKCGYSLPGGKSIASSVFIFELTMSYSNGVVTKASEFALRLGYRHCISMRTYNTHDILQDPSSKKWSGIKDVALTITEVSDPDTLDKIASLKGLKTFNASLNYVSPVSKTIKSNGVGSWGTDGSIGTYGSMQGTTDKTIIIAKVIGRSWTPEHYTNLQTGTAYLSILLTDNTASLDVYDVTKTIDIVAPPIFDITTTPDGSEIDDASEAGFSE